MTLRHETIEESIVAKHSAFTSIKRVTISKVFRGQQLWKRLYMLESYIKKKLYIYIYVVT